MSDKEKEILDQLLEEARCGADNIRLFKITKNVSNAANYVFEKHGSDPGEYQGFLLGVAWAVLTDHL